MVLNAAVQYAVIIIQTLKSNPSKLVPAYTISKDNQLSSHFVDQVCRKLRNAGIVKSTRGPGGGYSMAHNDDITVFELVNIMTEVKQNKRVHASAQSVQSKVDTLLNQIAI